MFNVDVARGRITEHSGATKLFGVGLTPSSVQQAATNSGFQLIAENSLARDELLLLKVAHAVRVLCGDGGAVRSACLSAMFASPTKGRIIDVHIGERQSLLVQVPSGSKGFHM